MKRTYKFRNVPTTVNGIRFASKAEAKRDAELGLLERAKQISGLIRQPRFVLRISGHKICTYVADWQYCEHFPDGKTVRVVEDKKGVQTPAFKLKWKMCQALWPDVEWRLS